MKCINNKKVRKTLILIGVLAGFFLVGIIALVLFTRGGQINEPLPYSRSARMFETSVQESSTVAEGIAENLCVGASNNALDGVDAQEGEMAGLFDIRNGEIPFSQNIYQQKSAGRLAQLMTVLVAYETLDMDSSVTIEQEDIPYGAYRTCGLSVGNVISGRQLLNAAAVYSAEDACLALARAASGSASAFVESMNNKAKELGMTNTSYTDPAGTDEEGQYTTVYDTYLLLNAILEHPDLTNTLGLSSYTLDYSRADGEQKQQWLSSDNLYVTGTASSPRGVTVLGGKMNAAAENNYAALLVQDNYGNPYVVIVLNTDSQVNLYERMEQMMEKLGG